MFKALAKRQFKKKEVTAAIVLVKSVCRLNYL